VTGGERDADPNYGPVITQYIDYRPAATGGWQARFLLEDAAYPSFAAWYVEGIRPALSLALHLHPHCQNPALGVAVCRAVTGLRQMGWFGSGLLPRTAQGRFVVPQQRAALHGRDAADGVLSLQSGKLALDWPQTH